MRPSITLLLWFLLLLLLLHVFLSSETGARSLSPRIPQNWAEPEDCGRRRANIGWLAPPLPHSLTLQELGVLCGDEALRKS